MASSMPMLILGSMVLGALLLWLAQWVWGILRVPVRARLLELEMDELKQGRAALDAKLAAAIEEADNARTTAQQQTRARRQLTATLDARNRKYQKLEAQFTALERRLRVVQTAPPETAAVERPEITPPRNHAGPEEVHAQQELRHALITQERLRAEVELLKEISDAAESEMAALRTRLREAEAGLELSSSRPPAWVMNKPNGSKDDLQALEGVDDHLEHSLNRLGIYHFHQIARFEASDIDWLMHHVDGVEDAVVRDSWVPFAAQLSRAH